MKFNARIGFSSIDFLPNETGCYFTSKPESNNTFSLYISNFKWDTTFNITGYGNSPSGRKMALWTNEGTICQPFILDIFTKKIYKIPPIFLDKEINKVNNFYPAYFRVNFINNDLILVIRHGIYYSKNFDNILAYYIKFNKKMTGLQPFVKTNRFNSNLDESSVNFSFNTEYYIVKPQIDSSSIFIHNVKNNIIRKFPFRGGDFEWLSNDGDYVVVQTKSDKKVWLFNVLSRRQIQVGTASPSGSLECKLYISPDKKTVKLIELSEKTLSIHTILESGINYADKGAITADVYTDKGRGFDSIDIVDGMLQVKLRDGSYILLFLESRKNKFPYLADKMYPALSPMERVQYGLGNK